MHAILNNSIVWEGTPAQDKQFPLSSTGPALIIESLDIIPFKIS